MTLYTVTIKAKRERFMERPLRDEWTVDLIADSETDVLDNVRRGLAAGGWEEERITYETREVRFIRDIRHGGEEIIV